jgi:hypothetical protein
VPAVQPVKAQTKASSNQGPLSLPAHRAEARVRDPASICLVVLPAARPLPSLSLFPAAQGASLSLALGPTAQLRTRTIAFGPDTKEAIMSPHVPHPHCCAGPEPPIFLT